MRLPRGDARLPLRAGLGCRAQARGRYLSWIAGLTTPFLSERAAHAASARFGGRLAILSNVTP
jgi:hypothetical protein